MHPISPNSAKSFAQKSLAVGSSENPTAHNFFFGVLDSKWHGCDAVIHEMSSNTLYGNRECGKGGNTEKMDCTIIEAQGGNLRFNGELKDPHYTPESPTKEIPRP